MATYDSRIISSEIRENLQLSTNKILAGYTLLTKAIFVKLAISSIFVILAVIILIVGIEESTDFACLATASASPCALKYAAMGVACLIQLPRLGHGLSAYSTLGLQLLVPTVRGKSRGESSWTSPFLTFFTVQGVRLGLVGVSLQNIYVNFTYENDLWHAYIADAFYPLLTSPFALIAVICMLPVSIVRSLCARASGGKSTDSYLRHSTIVQVCCVILCLLLDILLSFLFIAVALLLIAGSQSVGDIVVKFVAGYFLATMPTMATRAYLLPDDEVAQRMADYVATDDTLGAFYSIDVQSNTYQKLTDI